MRIPLILQMGILYLTIRYILSPAMDLPEEYGLARIIVSIIIPLLFMFARPRKLVLEEIDSSEIKVDMSLLRARLESEGSFEIVIDDEVSLIPHGAGK